MLDDEALRLRSGRQASASSRRRKTAADLAAFRASAAGWADVDTEALINYLYRS